MRVLEMQSSKWLLREDWIRRRRRWLTPLDDQRDRPYEAIWTMTKTTLTLLAYLASSNARAFWSELSNV